VHVAFNVEVLVLYPDWMVEVEEAVGQLLPKCRDGRDPERELLAQTFEAVAARNGGRVQFQHRAHMQWLGRGFQVEEARIEPAESLKMLHRAMVGPVFRV